MVYLLPDFTINRFFNKFTDCCQDEVINEKLNKSVSIWLITQSSFSIYEFRFVFLCYSIVFFFSSQRFLECFGIWWLSLLLLQCTRFIWFIYKKFIIISDVESKRKLFFRQSQKYYKETMQYVGTRLIRHKQSRTDSNVINFLNELPHKLPKKLRSRISENLKVSWRRSLVPGLPPRSNTAAIAANSG